MAEGASYRVPEMRRIARVHLVGIGGTGMCGIAEVLLHQGYDVSGSDISMSATTRRLQSLGASIAIGHAVGNVEGADVVVTSSAIGESNPEVTAAHAARIPVVARAEMLGELMRYRHGIAIAGTHGKTTTTSLVTAIFQAADRDPTFVIGGLLASTGSNARLGMSRYIIAEADESDASFLYLQPMLAVVTNIDRDHMATYEHDFERLQAAFVEFVHRLPFYGAVVLCLDDPVVAQLLPRLSRPMLTYGIASDADFVAQDITRNGRRWRFTVSRPAPHAPLKIELGLPGDHNVLNTLAAVAVATDEGLPDQAIIDGIAGFEGVGRRFQVFDECRVGAAGVTLVDDYGHHPNEVRSVVQTARHVWPDRRLVMVYQPHRYTRTRDLYDDFARVLASVDALLLLEVYAAGEAVIPGADGQALSQGVRARGGVNPIFVTDVQEALAVLPSMVQEGDVVLVQGAGNVNQVSNRLVEESGG